uniref:Putative trypsin-like peptidase domain containing protein n=1 Tax=viral metagenome TaxID=1070528 RepID=A0A6M3L5J6_9ZZZZ
MKIERELLLPNVRVRSVSGSGGAGGSGTVLYSAPNGGGGNSTYILTNHHVVENNIEVQKKWSPLLKKKVDMDILGTVEVHFFKWQYSSRAIGATEISADIMTYDVEEDLALLKIRDEDPAPAVAKMFPRGKEKNLRLGEPLYAIGAGMGEAPVITQGILSQFGREIDNREFWLSTAPTIFGNSGGAVYLTETQEFLGVPARIAVVASFFGSDAITHLSYFIPITRVYGFLEAQMFRFIYDPENFTEAEESQARDEARKAEERKLVGGDEGGGGKKKHARS